MRKQAITFLVVLILGGILSGCLTQEKVIIDAVNCHLGESMADIERVWGKCCEEYPGENEYGMIFEKDGQWFFAVFTKNSQGEYVVTWDYQGDSRQFDCFGF